MKSQSTNSRYLFLALVSAFLFATATPVSKLLLEGLTAFQLAGLLYIGAALGVAPMLFRKERRLSLLRLDRKNIIRLLGAVTLGGVAGPAFLLLGLQIASASSVALWLNLELVFTALLGWLFFHDHLGRFGWAGVIGVVVAGILLSIGEGSSGLISGTLIALACLCWGFDNHFTALIDGVTPAYSTFVKGVIAGTTNLAIGLCLHPLLASPTEISAGLVLGALAYGASITLYISAAQKLGATRGQSLFATAPFFSVLLALVLLGESLSTYQLAAALALSVSLLVMFRDKHKHQHGHEELIHEHHHRHDDGHHDHEHEEPLRASSHSHRHEHKPTRHSHPHWPDLHHRHYH